jgi:hypothetical protein
MLDLNATYTLAATDDDKVTMCIEAHRVLKHSIDTFDTMLVRANNKQRVYACASRIIYFIT